MFTVFDYVFMDYVDKQKKLVKLHGLLEALLDMGFEFGNDPKDLGTNHPGYKEEYIRAVLSTDVMSVALVKNNSNYSFYYIDTNNHDFLLWDSRENPFDKNKIINKVKKFLKERRKA